MDTQAVYGIEGDGGLSNCGRTNKEGIDWYKADDTGYERYLSLYNTPQKYNGCQGCRFFMLCSGGCVGEAIDGDFRNKTIHCATMKSMLGYYEEIAKSEGKTPWTLRDDRKLIESVFMSDLEKGWNTNYESVKGRIKQLTSRTVEVR